MILHENWIQPRFDESGFYCVINWYRLIYLERWNQYNRIQFALMRPESANLRIRNLNIIAMYFVWYPFRAFTHILIQIDWLPIDRINISHLITPTHTPTAWDMEATTLYSISAKYIYYAFASWKNSHMHDSKSGYHKTFFVYTMCGRTLHIFR